MTRAEKIEKRLERAKKRRDKRIAELHKIKQKMWLEDKSFRKARANVRGKYWGAGYSCEMGYADCEERGWCNGDC